MDRVQNSKEIQPSDAIRTLIEGMKFKKNQRVVQCSQWGMGFSFFLWAFAASQMMIDFPFLPDDYPILLGVVVFIPALFFKQMKTSENDRNLALTYRGWVEALPENGGDPIKSLLKKAILERMWGKKKDSVEKNRHCVENMLNEGVRQRLQVIMSAPTPVSDGDMMYIADNIPNISGALIRYRMKWGMEKLAYSGIFIKNPSLYESVRNLDLDWTGVAREEMDIVADILRAQVWADEVLDGMMYGQISVGEAEARLKSMSCMVVGASQALKKSLFNYRQPPSSRLGPEARPELVD